MATYLVITAATGKTTLVARAQWLSNSYFWNQTTSLWQAGDASFALTEGTGVMICKYTSAALVGMGDAGQVRVTIHDTAQSSKVIGAGDIFVFGGKEFSDAAVSSRATPTDAAGQTIEITTTTNVIEITEA